MSRNGKEEYYLQRKRRSYHFRRAIEDAHRRERAMSWQEAEFIMNGGEDPREKERRERQRARGFSVGRRPIQVAQRGAM